MRVPVVWRLESYIGDETTRGEAALDIGPRAKADLPLSRLAGLPDGPHRVRFGIGEAEDEEALYFDYRLADAHDVLGLRLAALLDSVEYGLMYSQVQRKGRKPR